MREMDQVLADGAGEMSDSVPFMLKKRIVEFVFIPWLCQYTQRVRDVAKEEERRAILGIPDLPEKVRKQIEARRL